MPKKKLPNLPLEIVHKIVNQHFRPCSYAPLQPWNIEYHNQNQTVQRLRRQLQTSTMKQATKEKLKNLLHRYIKFINSEIKNQLRKYNRNISWYPGRNREILEYRRNKNFGLRHLIKYANHAYNYQRIGNIPKKNTKHINRAKQLVKLRTGPNNLEEPWFGI